MTVSFDPSSAASVLGEAWRTGRPVPALPAAARPTTLEEGYAIQDAFVAGLGEQVVGWKLGGCSPAGKRQNGLSVPLIGQVVASRSLRAGDTVPRPGGRPLVIEFEIAFVLTQDIEPDAIGTVPDLVSAHAAFELVQSRYVDRAAATVPETVADNAFAHAIVLGEALNFADLDAIVESVVVSLDGVEAARGLAGDNIVDPFGGLHEFMAFAAARGLKLRRGDVILTGTLTRPVEAAVSVQTVSARYLDKTLACLVTTQA